MDRVLCDLAALRLDAALSVAAAAELAGVRRRTWIHWERAGSAPRAVAELLRIRAGWLDGWWRGWRIHRGRLWSPEGRAYTPGELASLPYLHQLQRELERLRGAPCQYLIGF